MNKLCMHSQRKVHRISDLSAFTFTMYFVFNIPRTRAPGLNFLNTELIYEKLHLMCELAVVCKRHL